jgi:hypothetical protein
VGNELNGSRGGAPHLALPPLTAVAVAAVLGLGLLLVAWVGASDQRDSADQMAWLNVGVAGVLVTGAAGGTWILRARRAVEERLTMMLAGTDDIVLLDAVPERATPERLATAIRMTRYHVPECLLVHGKALSFDIRSELERSGLQPCEMCRP